MLANQSLGAGGGNLCQARGRVTGGMEAMDVKYRPAVFPNGSVKKVAKQAAAVGVGGVAVVPRYRECLKNHAACMGGHAVDGCGEFMPSPEVNPADPSSLKCAACGCHRNFHRRVLMEGSSPSPPPQPRPQPQVALLPAPPVVAASVLNGLPQHGEETPEVRLPAADGDDDDDSESDSDGSEYDDERSVSPPQQLQPPPPAHLPAPVAQQPPAYFSSPPHPQHMLLSLNSTAPPGATQRVIVQASPATAPPGHAGGAPARKRFRSKFTGEQKQRMQELSERLGWRLQKRDESIVDEWCRDIGVSKGVFKVWMHNNKHNYLGGHSARRSASAVATACSAAPTPTAAPAPAAAGPFHISPAPGAPPPFIPSVTHSSPAPAATGFNINGTAAPAFAAVHQVNGTSSPQSA